MLQVLASLKILNLSHSNDLKYTPIFTGVLELEILVLKHCISLVEIDESIGKLKKLVYLDLEGCKKLRKLPREIGNLTSLKKFILSGCSNLDQLPTELGHMRSLTELHANDISQETSLVQSSVLKFRKSPKTLHYLPSSLVNLYLSNCNLSSVADCLGSLSSLEILDLRNNPISSLPESIKALANLHSLELAKCTNLKSLPELPMTLQRLDIEECSSLETMKNLPNLRKNFCMDSLHATPLVEVQGIFKLEPIGNAYAEIINGFGLSSDLITIRNFDVELFNRKYSILDKVLKGRIQVLYECGVHSIFLPRSLWPDCSWCSSNRRMGPSMTFKVPSLPNLKIHALKIFVVLDYGQYFTYSYTVFIRLNHKGKKWTYTPWYMGKRPAFNKMETVWLSYWKMGNHFILEAGDEVNVSACFINDFRGSLVNGITAVNYYCDGSKKHVKEIGVDLIYEKHEEEGSQHNKAYSHHQNVNNAIDLSEYQLRPCCYKYHLCNFDGYLSSLCPPEYVEKILFEDKECEDSEQLGDSECEDSDCELFEELQESGCEDSDEELGDSECEDSNCVQLFEELEESGCEDSEELGDNECKDSDCELFEELEEKGCEDNDCES